MAEALGMVLHPDHRRSHSTVDIDVRVDLRRVCAARDVLIYAWPVSCLPVVATKIDVVVAL